MADVKDKIGKIEQLNTRIVALSSDAQKQSQSYRKEAGLPFDLLCDPDRQVIEQYHLLNPDDHGGVAYPALYVLKSCGTIGYRSLDRTAKRVNISEVLDYLERVNEDESLLLDSVAQKEVIIPAPSALLQIGKNMLLRGTLKDWKHYIQYPFSQTYALLRKKNSR